ncbi:DJ-1/PfpI family protein [Chryseobacterium sp. Bi04]|uniref:GlxA family transcriptional regulator n=1 Tax=Chryseobacterium sp. Bi04 TaxID=2822345 RepID=UPI001DD81697|nr:DJ-1/PfpI family protein [Chryseobacterium sp. Bi04]CAH0193922.1 HTH-type transcriptional regulator CdhR [Chryseobacterium sp. Bi04]
MKKHVIVIVAMPDALTLDITGPADVFTMANDQNNDINYEVHIVSPTNELEVITRSGVKILTRSILFNTKLKIDTLLIAGFPSHKKWKSYPILVEWIKKHATKIRRIGSICVGAFVLAETGLLNNKQATTHWKNSQELQDLYKEINVLSDPIFVKDQNIYTSAGASAGIDLALALVEEDQGLDAALRISRYLVLYLRRPGNQSQFSNLLSQQLSSKKPIQNLQLWIAKHLQEKLNVERLSSHLNMSPRNFARVFLSETGFTPAKYIEKLRIESCMRLLQETDLSLKEIAENCGFSNSNIMGKAFLRHFNITPSYYQSNKKTKNQFQNDIML